MERLKWLRVIGDTVFAVGILTLAYWVVGLKTGWSLTGEADAVTKHFGPTTNEKAAENSA
jgi:nitric oxide reductase subunit B